MASKIYRSYSYVILGAEKVGKTNLITRFTKDQFNEMHTMTLEGQQTALLSIDGRLFEINVYDTAGQENIFSMKAVWRNGKDGYIFVYAINSRESYEVILKEIKQIKNHEGFRDVASILVGNKSDLQTDRQVNFNEAKEAAQKYGMDYFQVSAKSSFKQKIDKLIFELIDLNQIQRFKEDGDPKKTTLFDKIWQPCEQASCIIM